MGAHGGDCRHLLQRTPGNVHHAWGAVAAATPTALKYLPQKIVEAVEAAEEDLLEVDLPPVLLTFEAFAAFFSLSRDPDPPPDEAEPLPERWDDDLLSLAINGGLALLCSPPEK